MSSSENSAGSHRRMKFFSKEANADVHFLVGTVEKETILAHKQILANANELFKKMLQEIFEVDYPIEVPDIEPAAFLNLLGYFYGCNLELTVENVHEVFNAAKKYKEQSVINHCEKFLLQEVTPDNVFGLLARIDLVVSSNFLSECIEKILLDADIALESKNIVNISLRTLRVLLSQDKLACSEVELFKSVVRWANAECDRQNLPCNPDNQRLVLGDTLDLVRFPIMTSEDLHAYVRSTEILDKQVFHEIVKWSYRPNKYNMRYSTTPRHAFDETLHSIEVPLMNNKCEFRVNKTIILTMVVAIIGSKKSSISVSDCHGEKNVLTSQVVGVSMRNGPWKFFYIDCPIKIRANQWTVLKIKNCWKIRSNEKMPDTQNEAGTTFTFRNEEENSSACLVFRAAII